MRVAISLHVPRGLAVDGDEHVPGLEGARRRTVLLDAGDHHHVAVLDPELVQGDGDGALLRAAHRGGVGQGGLLAGLPLGEDRLARQHHLRAVEPGGDDLDRGDVIAGAAVDGDGGHHQLAVGGMGLGAVDREDLLVLPVAEHVDRGAGPFDDVGDGEQGAAEDHRAQQHQHRHGQSRPGQLGVVDRARGRGAHPAASGRGRGLVGHAGHCAPPGGAVSVRSGCGRYAGSPTDRRRWP
jgi:hypothetical protein